VNRREFVVSAGAGAVGVAGEALWPRQANGATRDVKRPNLVFIFSDQQAYDAVGYAGANAHVKTPTLDRLAAQGVWFNHAVSSSPVCTPHRGMLLTGRHPLYCGAYENDIGAMHNIGDTFADVLTAAGYATAYVGKWHLHGGQRGQGVPSGPARLGFGDIFFTDNCSLTYSDGFYYDPASLAKVNYGEWVSTGQTRQALDFLESRRGTTDPFALFVSWHPPHNWGGGYGGYDCPAEWKSLYNREELHCRQFGLDASKQTAFHGYLSMCSMVDDHVRTIAGKLESLGVAEDTLIVYTSDHGDHFAWPAGRSRHKQSPEAVSCRVPLMMRWPHGLRQRRKSDLIIGTLDLMPTILGLMGLPVPATCQGHDLSTAIQTADDEAMASAPLFLFSPCWRGVYTREYTYSIQNYVPAAEDARMRSSPGSDLTCLYDKQIDPWCTTDRMDDPAYDGVRAELHAQTMEWLARFKDPFVNHNTLLDVTFHPGYDSHELGSCTPAEATFTTRPIDALHAHGYTQYDG